MIRGIKGDTRIARMRLALQHPTRSTDLNNMRVPRALQQPARSTDLGNLRLAHVPWVQKSSRV